MSEQKQEVKEDEDTVDFAKFAEYSSQLYSDFFTEPTRKRQSNLLVCAILVIVVSHSLLNFTQGDIFGLSFPITDQTILLWALRVICVYFLVIYVLGVLQDYQAFSFREKLILYKIYKFSQQLKDTPKEEIRDKFLGDMWFRDEWGTIIASSAIEIASAASSGVFGSLSLVKSILSFARKEKPDRNAFEKGKFSSSIVIDKYKSFSILRNSIEIGFPVMLGLFALWISFV